MSSSFELYERRSHCEEKYPYSELFWSAFFPHFWVWRALYLVQIRENAGKMQPRITPNTDNFYAVSSILKSIFIAKES